MSIAHMLLAMVIGSVLPPGVPPAAKPIDQVGTPIPTAQDVYSRMTVGVFVNGQGPYPFAIDTGADRTAVSRSVTDQLSLPKGGSVLMHSMAGVGRIDLAMIENLRIGAREVEKIRAPVLSDQHLGVAGLLGIDGLANQRVEMDFINGQMTVVPSAATRAEEPRDEPGTIVVRARRKFGQLILVDADIDGEKVHVIVDSGAQMSIGNAALRRRLAHRGKVLARQVEMEDVAGRKMLADVATLSEMRIGGIKVYDMPIAWAEAHPFKLFGLKNKPAMLLGMDLLRSFERVSIDFGDKKVRFLPRDDKGG